MPLKDKPQGLLAQRAAAQEVATSALSFIAGDGERLVRFMSETGLTPATLRPAAARPDFGAGVLAFLMSDESLLLAFAAEAGLDPRHVAAAHDLLSPPDVPDAVARRPR